MASRSLAAAVRPSALHAARSLTALNMRKCSSKLATQQQQKPKRSPSRPEPSTTHDWIGPPNPLSNLRPVVYHVAHNESQLQRRLRRLRQETEDWHHDFWTKQNISFSKEKDTFISSQLSVKGLTERDEDGRRRTLNSEEMAVFYKSFLDTNRIRHSDYNKEWYRRNFLITLLMARVALKNTWRTFTERHKRTS